MKDWSIYVATFPTIYGFGDAHKPLIDDQNNTSKMLNVKPYSSKPGMKHGNSSLAARVPEAILK